MPASDWSVALADLEAQVAAIEEALLQGEPEASPATWQPPRVVGPIPEELKARARDLLARVAAVEDSITTVMTDNVSAQKVTNVYSSGRERSPLYIDAEA